MASKSKRSGEQGKGKARSKRARQPRPVTDLSAKKAGAIKGGLSDLHITQTSDKASPTIFH